MIFLSNNLINFNQSLIIFILRLYYFTVWKYSSKSTKMNLDQLNSKIYPKNNHFRVRIDKIISNGLSTCPRQKTQRSTKIYSRITNSTKLSKVSENKQNKNQEEFRQTRRQNQLNTLFRIRKEKLESINKQNRQIYERLNSQQSHYAKNRALKQKYNQEPLFSFRTIDSQQSRQILGPISNFRPACSFYTIQKQKRRNQNNDDLIDRSSCSLPIRARTRFSTINNDQSRFQTPIKCKQKPRTGIITPLKQNKSLQRLKAFRTPTRIIRLPQIYTFI